MGSLPAPKGTSRRREPVQQGFEQRKAACRAHCLQFSAALELQALICACHRACHAGDRALLDDGPAELFSGPAALGMIERTLQQREKVQSFTA